MNPNSEGVARPQAGGERSVTPAEVGSSKSPEGAADWRMTRLSTPMTTPFWLDMQKYFIELALIASKNLEMYDICRIFAPKNI